MAEVTDETRGTVGIVIMMEITTEIETVRDTDTEMSPLAVIEVRDILTEMTTVTENTELHHTRVTFLKLFSRDSDLTTSVVRP